MSRQQPQSTNQKGQAWSSSYRVYVLHCVDGKGNCVAKSLCSCSSGSVGLFCAPAEWSLPPWCGLSTPPTNQMAACTSLRRAQRKWTAFPSSSTKVSRASAGRKRMSCGVPTMKKLMTRCANTYCAASASALEVGYKLIGEFLSEVDIKIWVYFPDLSLLIN